MHQINSRSVCLLEAFKSIKYLGEIIILTKHCWWDHHNLQLSFKLTGSLLQYSKKENAYSSKIVCAERQDQF